jgi:membrane protein implicated in regulation of membrane protease activity
MLEIFLYVFFWPAMLVDWLGRNKGGVFGGQSSLLYFGSIIVQVIYFVALAFLLVNAVR